MNIDYNQIYDFLQWQKLNNWGVEGGYPRNFKAEALELYKTLKDVPELILISAKFLEFAKKTDVSEQEIVPVVLEAIEMVDSKRNQMTAELEYIDWHLNWTYLVHRTSKQYKSVAKQILAMLKTASEMEECVKEFGALTRQKKVTEEQLDALIVKTLKELEKISERI